MLPAATIKGIAITAGGGVDPVRIYAITAVPEPTTAALALLGLGALVVFRKRS